MSRNACIRQCGRRRSPPSPLCSQCQGKEKDRLFNRGRTVGDKQREFYGSMKRLKGKDWY